MKNKLFVIVFILMIFPVSSFADRFDRYKDRYEMVKKSDKCVEMVRKMEFKRNPDRLPAFDVYCVIPKTRYSSKAQKTDIEEYQKCMEN